MIGEPLIIEGDCDDLIKFSGSITDDINCYMSDVLVEIPFVGQIRLYYQDIWRAENLTCGSNVKFIKGDPKKDLNDRVVVEMPVPYVVCRYAANITVLGMPVLSIPELNRIYNDLATLFKHDDCFEDNEAKVKAVLIGHKLFI